MLATNVRPVARPHVVGRLLMKKLSTFSALTDEDSSLIQAHTSRPRDYPGGVAIPFQRRPMASVVVSGWIGRLRLLADGRRQVISTMIPGELAGSHPNPFISHGVVALTDARIADLMPLLAAIDREPDRYQRLRKAFSLARKLEEAQVAEHVVRLGRRTAFERLVHWLLDLQERLNLAGLCDGDRFHMPLTQETLSDILGISVVHVNRMVKQLRAEELIELRGGVITILEPERMKMLSEFSPLKLAQTAAPRSLASHNFE